MRGRRTTGCLAGFRRILLYTKGTILPPMLPFHSAIGFPRRIFLVRWGQVYPLSGTKPRGRQGACVRLPACFRHLRLFRSAILHSIVTAIKLTGMPSLSLGLIAEGDASAGVDDGGLLDDEAVLGQAGDVAAAVGQRDLVDLVGVEPDLALTAIEDVGRKALLELERHCSCEIWGGRQ